MLLIPTSQAVMRWNEIQQRAMVLLARSPGARSVWWLGDRTCTRVAFDER